MGTGRGRVVRIARDLLAVEGSGAAGLLESVREPHVLVEVVIDQLPSGAPATGAYSGMVFTGEIALRRQRVITILLEPLREIFGTE